MYVYNLFWAKFHAKLLCWIQAWRIRIRQDVGGTEGLSQMSRHASALPLQLLRVNRRVVVGCLAAPW